MARERIEPFLQKLPVDALWGVGPVTGRKLRAAGIERLVDIRTVDDATLHDVVGSQADWLKRLARGIDNRPVVANRSAKSHSSERTYAEDLDDLETIRGEIERMARASAAWLARQAIFARTVTIKVRYHDFTTVTRSDTQSLTTQVADEVARRAQTLLDRTDAAPAHGDPADDAA